MTTQGHVPCRTQVLRRDLAGGEQAVVTRVVEPADARSLAEALGELAAHPTVRSVLMLGCCGDGWSPAVLGRALGSVSVPVLGGLFPGIVVDGAPRRSGTLLIGLPAEARVSTLALDGSRELRLPAFAASPGSGPDGAATSVRTALVFADACSERVSGAVEAIFDALGTSCSYLGGGTGHRDLTPAPSVIADGELHEGVAVVAVLSAAAHIGVAHGWLPVGPHLPVTAATGRWIHELDGRPAAATYREVVREHTGGEGTTVPLEQLGRWYPLGIARVGAEPVVRDLVEERDGSLACIADVPAGCYVRILHGDRASLLDGARRVGEVTRAALEREGGRGQVLLMDCVSRVDDLGDRFVEELEAIDIGRPLVGALTIGEIANGRDRVLDFYNKTVVLGVIGSDDG